MTEGVASTDVLVRLSPPEAEIVRTALRLLRNMLGRDEADELAVVMALLERLESGAPDATPART
jgi:Arc/MetJ-type ribon-helix-helix transcriptional regulator